MNPEDLDISRADSTADALDRLAKGLEVSNEVVKMLEKALPGIVPPEDATNSPLTMVANLRIWAEWLRMHPDTDAALYSISSFGMGDLSGT